MKLEQVLEDLKQSERFRGCIAGWHHVPPRAARHGDFPEWLDPRLTQVLRGRGIERPFTHQGAALNAVHDGRSVVVVTPTASGKTMCYNLPVLDAILKDEDARALYLFPTKALSQDQMTELHGLITELGADIKTYTYDGDTPTSARKAIRTAGHVVVTNPDMLHTGILPHHTRWVKLFENLRYVVIDEVHHYRGVFGSHVANVIRRLRRVCRFYGSDPIFICASATIANPLDLAERLVGGPLQLIDDNGAPSGAKEFILYNPPVVNRELGIRRSSALEAQALAANFLRNDVQTIVFARSRVTTELLLTYLRENLARHPGLAEKVHGYRGGYLPLQRRAIERGLRDGSVRGVVATNALELGIDIGRLDACVIVGYPGSVSSTWQQAGRVGRRAGTSVVVLVGSSNPLDQYLMAHPDYFFGQPPESGLVNPDNLLILLSHVKCAAFELPFEAGEEFGVESTEQVLDFLAEQKLLRRVDGRYHWMAEDFPAEEISLRSAAAENFVIIDTTDGQTRVIGEVDRISAPMLIHEEAIYIHEGQQHHVDRLDWGEKKAYVRKVDVDYYTDANLAVRIQVLDVFKSRSDGDFPTAYGEVLVAAMATMFKKIKLFSHENIGSGRIHLPEEQMHTTAYWLSVPETAAGAFPSDDLQSGLVGLANVLVNVAPLFLLCDPRDVQVVAEVKSPFTGLPTIYLYDRYPGGVGLAEKLYDVSPLFLKTALDLISGCSCENGCPACVGPVDEVGPRGKAAAVSLLREAIRSRAAQG